MLKIKTKSIKTRQKCMYDYKNAISVGKIDHICPLCKELLDPLGWFFMNSFEFIDVIPKDEK